MARGAIFLPLLMILLGAAMVYAGLTGKSEAVIKAVRQ